MSKRGSFLRCWLPVVVWMSLIFAGSTDVLSSRHTSRVIGPLLRWLIPSIPDEAVRAVVAVVRKGGHVAEYSVLALLFWRAFRRPGSNDPHPWSWREAALAVLLAGLYACTDEFHQSFVPSRGASVWDVLLDTLGATAAIGILWLWGQRHNKW